MFKGMAMTAPVVLRLRCARSPPLKSLNAINVKLMIESSVISCILLDSFAAWWGLLQNTDRTLLAADVLSLR